METKQKDAEARGLSDDFVCRTGLGTSERAEAEEGLAVEVVVGAGQGQGRAAVAGCVLFVAGRRNGNENENGMHLEQGRGAGAGGMVVDGVAGQATAATSAERARARDGGDCVHRRVVARRRRGRVATGEAWSLSLEDSWPGSRRGARSVRGWWEREGGAGDRGSRGGRKRGKDFCKKGGRRKAERTRQITVSTCNTRRRQSGGAGERQSGRTAERRSYSSSSRESSQRCNCNCNCKTLELEAK